ncbi:hypothetical protein TNCV_2673531 [Trichonephila clavipes]|nr:hypothetical protein TNCV_2673531 [Trichonephila clavipes]
MPDHPSDEKFINHNWITLFREQCFDGGRERSNQLVSLHKTNALREIKLRSPYLQGKSTTMSVIAHQTEKEWISANEKNRQRMAQIHAEGEAENHAARLEDAYLRAHHSCFTTLERCQPETAHLRQT